MKVLIDSCVFIDAFDSGSYNHESAVTLLRELLSRKILVTMPSHGWFEVQCTLQRLSEITKQFTPPTFDGNMQYPIQLIHIDQHFIEKYSMASIPYIKAGDHIFIAVAKIENYSLITSDEKMISVAKKCGVQVFTPDEFKIKLVSGTII